MLIQNSFTITHDHANYRHWRLKFCDGPSSETFKHALDAAILTILCDIYYYLIVFILLSINMHILYLCILNVLLILQSRHSLVMRHWL